MTESDAFRIGWSGKVPLKEGKYEQRPECYEELVLRGDPSEENSKQKD